MLQTFRAIEHLASRIERAYLRRRPQWRELALDDRIWAAAVAVLVEANRVDPRAPLDPELFVACVVSGTESDPWMELTRPAARCLYLLRVRAMIRTLRRELNQELRKAEKLHRRGLSLAQILRNPSRSLSALGRYLIAVRHDHAEFASELRPAAQAQHEACPLYREAASGLIAADLYPLPLEISRVSSAMPRGSFNWN